ncbi:hypothetical protein [Streptomyces sp. NPDC050535]|uniref:hypothetical protein n=1 Tax=Streptomyces sp. NPDC050535 TaxID=3365626 RepID=UPI00379CB991
MSTHPPREQIGYAPDEYARTNRCARWARAEWGPLYAALREALRADHLRTIPLTSGAVLLTAALQFTQNQTWGFRFVQNIGSVRADDPLPLALARTPLSLFVPALDLPVWGALAQILVVFAIAEIVLGRWRTLVIAYVATLAGTLYARVGIALGPDSPLGLPAADRYVVDTGPSAAVVGLAVFVCRRCRAYVTGAAVIVAMLVETVLKENLAGKEHLAAVAAVMLMCGISAARHRPPGSERTGSSGLPPIQSWKTRRGPAQRRSWW